MAEAPSGIEQVEPVGKDKEIIPMDQAEEKHGTPNRGKLESLRKLFGRENRSVLGKLKEEEAASFKRDITNFIIEEKYPTRNHIGSLETFFQHFPQYKNYSLEELKQNAPEYIDFSVQSKRPDISLSYEKAFGRFLYRGEGSEVGGATPIPIVDLLESFSRQGGIGGTTTGSKVIKRTYVSKDPHYALNYSLTRDFKTGDLLEEARGVWVIKKSVLELEDLQAKYETPLERATKGVIPLKYVEKLLVTDKTREQILRRYGAENTQLFGRPIKDVVQVALNTDLDETRDLYLKTVLELNLQSQE